MFGDLVNSKIKCLLKNVAYLGENHLSQVGLSMITTSS